MKKQFIPCILLAVNFLSMAGCSVSDSYDSEYSKWTFSGTVVDSENGQGLDGAQISYQNSDGDVVTGETDSEGNFLIKDLPYGSLIFTFSYTSATKDDTIYYAPKVMNVSSSGESSHMEGVVAGTAQIVRLSPLNAKVTGSLYIADENSGAKIPVPETRLYIVAEDTSFINTQPESFETMTDSLGNFTFKNLPADTGFILEIESYTYKDLRYTSESLVLPRLKSLSPTDLGRIFMVRDTLVEAPRIIKASNVMDENGMGYENVSQLEVPYYVFNENLSLNNISVTVTADSNSIYVEPIIKGDTLYLEHGEAFPPETPVTVQIVAYGKSSGDRIEMTLDNTAAFTTSAGIRAVASNTWPSSENFKASFGVKDTIWVKFSKTLSSNTDRIQWNYTSGVDCSIYANGYYANSNAWVSNDTLFVQMLESILENRDQGDSVGMNMTVYASDGTYADGLIFRTELNVPADSSDAEE